MSVTASKVLLGLSLTAFTYCSWDHLFPSKPETAAPSKTTTGAAAQKGKELTAGVVNRTVVLKLERDPFNSVPLGQSLISEAALPNEPGKDLGELDLQGVVITLAERAAVINGKTLREGQTMQTGTGATIRAKRIGVDSCIIEGGGRVVMLHVDETAQLAGKSDAKKVDPKKGEAKKSGGNDPAGGTNKNAAVAGVNPQQR